MLSGGAARGQSRALWSPGGTTEGLPPPRLSSRGATGSSSVLPGLPLLRGAWHHPGRGQILVLVFMLVVGSPCPTLEAAVGKGGAGVTFVGADWQVTSYPPRSLAWGLLQPPSPTGRAAVEAGGGQSIPQRLRGLGAGGSSACRSWYGNVLASRSCRGRCCRMLFTPPGTFSHLFCASLHPRLPRVSVGAPVFPRCIFRGALRALAPLPTYSKGPARWLEQKRAEVVSM